ncbi:MAG: biopolymer transporter ExbD [Planctomycetales bacterium]|nr:biopolymer transporter ExbD [Planctomycetales bacterium]
MRIPNSSSGRGGGLDATMTPMIDVVFLLLVFFVWTASIAAVEHLLPSSLRAAPGSAAASVEPPPPPDFDPVVVKIVWLGESPGWIVSGNAVRSLAQVRQTLEAVAQIKQDLPVIIDPAADVPLGAVIDVYDTARLAGFEKIQFAASEDV